MTDTPAIDFPCQQLKMRLHQGYLPATEALSIFDGRQHSLNLRIHRLRASGLKIGTLTEGRRLLGYLELAA